MPFQFEVTELIREDKTTGKVVMRGRTKGGHVTTTYIYVPIAELSSYHIDDKFVLLPAAASVAPVRTVEEFVA